MNARAVGACVFDAYGTLLDLSSALAPDAASLGEAAAPLLALWRRKQLEYTWLRTLMGRHADFETVTRDALGYALEAIGDQAPGMPFSAGAPVELETRLGDAFRRLAAYPAAGPALSALRAAGIRTAVLSNGNPDMLRDAFDHAGLTPALDRVLSVQPLGVYKPSPLVYALASEALEIEATRIVFVSGNAWDAAGAANAGLRAVLIDPAGAPPERLPAAPAATIRSLAELPALVLGW
jgi:2-haloacid dehalogenase